MGIDNARYETFQAYFYGFLWIFILAATALVYITTGEPNLWAIPVLLLGLTMFLVAKISVVKSGHRFTFAASATEHMNLRMKWNYYTGYALMFAGFLLSFRHW